MHARVRQRSAGPLQDCHAATLKYSSHGMGFMMGGILDGLHDGTSIHWLLATLLTSSLPLLLPLQVRIGIHTGPCMTGVIGSKMPKFSIFGDTMNTASRMESTCVPGRMQVSGSTWELVKHLDNWEATGGIPVKGKGIMETYLWAGELPEPMPFLLPSTAEEEPLGDVFFETDAGAASLRPNLHVGVDGSGRSLMVLDPMVHDGASDVHVYSGDRVSPPSCLKLGAASSRGRRVSWSQKLPPADWSTLSCLASSALAATLQRTKSLTSAERLAGLAPR